MSKAYSTKALPSGTVLREWRLEEVLGVGGFGIVYKGRGIYFGELVAIKEYFPSSISERAEDDTVVPVDSDSEEVHALGLKKFVEEAKLLWNLSTPTRHPNIVSVRSLFEIHGTAYMVMDFEDGVSLSKLLKNGQRFNEVSLTNLIRPIAEGLERAHRVGVLHRDIKPPNILVSGEGKPVLIDFGSARFESADATSTKVTFHTPPYAAIEQYVKTYHQGPWTDIYALGVVLYECVTGQKPADVLERLHGGMETPLAEGSWPGYSKKFLAAIDAALVIKPDDRPQSIADWLVLFDNAGGHPADADDDDDEATRLVNYADIPSEIIPVAPPLPGFSQSDKPATDVPDDPKQVKFRGVGKDAAADKKDAEANPAGDEKVAKAAPETGVQAKSRKVSSAENKPTVDKSSKPSSSKADAGAASTTDTKAPNTKRRLRIGAIWIASIATAAAAWLIFGRSHPTEKAVPPQEPVVAAGPSFVPSTGMSDIASSLNALLAKARQAGAPVQALDPLVKASAVLGGPQAGPSPVSTSAPSSDTTVRAAAADFAAKLLSDADRRSKQIAAVSQGDPKRQALARGLRAPLEALRASVASVGSAAGSAEAIAAADTSLEHWRSFISTAQAVNRVQKTATAQAADDVYHEPVATPTPSAAPSAASPGGVSKTKAGQFDAIVSRTRQIARDAEQLASQAQRKDPDPIHQKDKDAARQYGRYLDQLQASMRGAKSDSEADLLIKQALQTQDYLRVIVTRSSAVR